MGTRAVACCLFPRYCCHVLLALVPSLLGPREAGRKALGTRRALGEGSSRPCDGRRVPAEPKDGVSRPSQATSDFLLLWDVHVQHLLRAGLQKQNQRSVGGIYPHF